MAWDDDKGPGDGLPSSEWDAMVADQKSNNGSVVQGSEPTVSNYDVGDVWYKTVTERANSVKYAPDYFNPLSVSGPYVVFGRNTIQGFDLSTGEKLYEVNPPNSGPTEANGGNIIHFDNVGDDLTYNDVYEYDITNGSLLNSGSAGQDLNIIRDEFAVYKNEMFCFTGTNGDSHYFSDATSGQRDFTYSSNNQQTNHGLDDKHLYINDGGKLVAASKTDGSQDWSDNFDYDKISSNNSTAVAAYDSASKTVKKYDQSGTVQWSTDYSSYFSFVDGIEVLPNGDVVMSHNKLIVVYDSTDGSVKDSYNTKISANFRFISSNSNGDFVNSGATPYLFNLEDQVTQYVNNGTSWVPSSTLFKRNK